MARGKKLSRQVARYLGSETAEEDVARLLKVLRSVESDLVAPSTLDEIGNLPAFLDVVDASYQKYEENLAVAERNITLSSEELIKANRAVGSMVNCLGQGFLMFDGDGICSPVYSLACETLLEITPAGKHIADVLRLNVHQRSRIESLLRLAFGRAHAMSFDEIMHFAPRTYPHSRGTHIQLDYKLEKTVDNKIDRIVMIASDVTEQIRAQELAEQRKALFESIERVLRDRQSFGAYIRRVSVLTDTLAKSGREWNGEIASRETHTLKGGAGMFRLTALAAKLHDLETAYKTCASLSSVGMRSGLLSVHAGIIQDEIATITERFKDLLNIDADKLEAEGNLDKKKLFDFARYLGGLGLDDVRQEYIRMVCTESLSAYMRRFDLVLGDLAERFNKKVHLLRFAGADVRVILDYYRDLLETLVHIFRNIMDHGIEAPDDRKGLGKDEAGLVEIEMALRNDAAQAKWLSIKIKDDGMGIDVNKLRAKLAVQEPQGRWFDRSDQEVLDSILTHNLTTRSIITEYSGRGVGMSTVYEEVKKLGGTMSISSTPGKGTGFHIEVPFRLEWKE